MKRKTKKTTGRIVRRSVRSKTSPVFSVGPFAGFTADQVDAMSPTVRDTIAGSVASGSTGSVPVADVSGKAAGIVMTAESAPSAPINAFHKAVSDQMLFQPEGMEYTSGRGSKAQVKRILSNIGNFKITGNASDGIRTMFISADCMFVLMRHHAATIKLLTKLGYRF